MKTTLSRITRCIVTTQIVLLLTGCATTTSDWTRAQQSNTVAAYKQSLHKHPDSKFNKPAHESIEHLHWKQTTNADRINAYKEFARRYPNSKFSIEAGKRIVRLIELGWKEAQQINTVKSYQTFLRLNPSREYAEKARERIQYFEQKEEDDWNNTKQKESTQSIVEFLRNNPEGKFSLEAKTALASHFNTDFKKHSNDLAKLTRFMTFYPNDIISSDSQLKIETRFVELMLKSDIKDRFVINSFAGAARKNIPTGENGRVTVCSTGSAIHVALNLEYSVDRMPVRYPGGAVLPTGHGTVWRFKGPVTNIMGFNFNGNPQNCLRFLLIEGHGLVYMYGEGEVALKNGNRVTLPKDNKAMDSDKK
jgi:hypothetical protein